MPPYPHILKKVAVAGIAPLSVKGVYLPFHYTITGLPYYVSSRSDRQSRRHFYQRER